MQVEFEDSKGKKWYMDQAERFNAFNFNKFKGWDCTSGFKGIIIREPDGSIKRSYSCADEPLVILKVGSSYLTNLCHVYQRVVYQVQIVRYQRRHLVAKVRIYPNEKID